MAQAISKPLTLSEFLPQQQPILCQGNQTLPVLPDLDLPLTVDQVFGWLKMGQ